MATNSVPLAARLSAAPGVTLHLLGGRVRGITQSAVGETTVRALDELRVDVAFLGTNGITAGHGFTTPDEAEAAVKRAMVRAGQRVVVLADSSKLGREHLVRFAAVGRRRRPGHRRRRRSRPPSPSSRRWGSRSCVA